MLAHKRMQWRSYAFVRQGEVACLMGQHVQQRCQQYLGQAELVLTCTQRPAIDNTHHVHLPARQPQSWHILVHAKPLPVAYPHAYDLKAKAQVRLCFADAGEPVAESPYPVRVLPGRPDPRRCALSGAGRRAAVAAVAAEFSVEARDCYGNRRAVWGSLTMRRKWQ